MSATVGWGKAGVMDMPARYEYNVFGMFYCDFES